MTRRQLMAQHPQVPVTCPADLDPDERVWTRSSAFGEAAHQRAPGPVRVAVCGVALSEWPTRAEDVAALGGGLCPDGCWRSDGDGSGR